MRRACASSAALAFTAISAFVCAAEPPVLASFPETSDAVVSVVAFDDGGSAVGFGGGFVASPDGLVVSAWGIVKKATKIRVYDASGRELPDAHLIHSSEDDGYALIQLEDTDLAAVMMGNSDLARVGDPVRAVSVPMGFERTVLTGQINGWTGPSEPQRMLTSIPRTQGMIGGPLFNEAGEVIGVNLAEGAEARSLPINKVDIALRAAADLP